MRKKTLYICIRAVFWVLAAAANATTCVYALDFYDAGRDQQAEAAKKEWSAVDPAGVVSTEQANLKKLLDEELLAQDQLATAVRDFRLREIVGHPLLDPAPNWTSEKTGGVMNHIQEELERLTGLSIDKVSVAMDEIQNADTKTKTYLNFLSSVQVQYDFFSLGTATCDGITSAGKPAAFAAALEQAKDDAKKTTLINATLDQMKQECPSKKPQDPNLQQLLKGEWATRYSDYQRRKAKLDAANDLVNSEKTNYEKALKDYQNAIKATPTPSVAGKGETATVTLTATQTDSAASKIQEVTTALKSAVSALESTPNSVAQKFLASERLSALSDLVTAASQGFTTQTVPSDNKAAAALVLFTNWSAQTQTNLATAAVPENLPLMLARDQEQLKLAAATADVQGWQSEVELSNELLGTITGEAQELWTAWQTLDKVRTQPLGPPAPTQGPAPKCDAATLVGSVTLDAAYSSPCISPQQKQALLTGAALYLDVVNRLDARRYKLSYMITAVSYDRTISYAALNVKRWQSLADVSVGQVADFYSGGVKPESVATFFHLLGILWIGNGVNK